MEDLFRAIFEAFPEKSSIFFPGKCIDCGHPVTIEIVRTSGGFGLLGGALVEYAAAIYAPKCPDCYQANGKMVERYKVISEDLLILHKKDLLSTILAANNWLRK